jgi:hypothetical protein
VNVEGDDVEGGEDHVDGGRGSWSAVRVGHLLRAVIAAIAMSTSSGRIIASMWRHARSR